MSITVTGQKGKAVLSEDRLYRYALIRPLSMFGGRAVWVLHNPSTADADEDDPTIRRVTKFTLREELGTLIVVNLFAFRATKPAVLKRQEHPLGAENLETVTRMVKTADRVVVAWGALDGKLLKNGGTRMIEAVKGCGKKLECLGTTFGGHPRHPLYVKGIQQLEEWKP